MSISQLIEPATKGLPPRQGAERRFIEPVTALEIPATHREPPRYITEPHSALLDLYGPPEPQRYCQSGRYDWVNTSTGEVVGEYCRRNSCLPCARRRVHGDTIAIALGGPTEFFTLTGFSTSWAVTRVRMNSLSRYLRRSGCPVEWVYTVEQNPRGTGAHAHGYLRGTNVGEQLPAALAAAGLGWAHHIRAARGVREIGYLFKEVRHNEASLAGFLERNGGYLHHHTQRYWRPGDGPGSPLAQARRRAKASDAEFEASPWRRIAKSASSTLVGAQA